MRLQIEAEPCPRVLGRALELVALQQAIPLLISYTRDETLLRFEFVVDGLSRETAETLVLRTRGLVMVRKAVLTGALPAIVA